MQKMVVWSFMRFIRTFFQFHSRECILLSCTAWFLKFKWAKTPKQVSTKLFGFDCYGSISCKMPKYFLPLSRKLQMILNSLGTQHKLSKWPQTILSALGMYQNLDSLYIAKTLCRAWKLKCMCTLIIIIFYSIEVVCERLCSIVYSSDT